MTTQYYSDQHRARLEIRAGRRAHSRLLTVFLNGLALVGITGIAFAVAAGALLGGQL